MAVLVLYASLYPFTGWRWPAGSAPVDLLALPWPPWLTPLDEALNLAGYVPLGLLVAVALLRSGLATVPSLVLALVLPAVLSYTTEVLQHLLPGRHPSLKDVAMNSLGALCGALLAALLHLGGALRHWQRLRQRWFERHSAGALALLALWPLGLLFPLPVPWGLGQAGLRLRQLAVDLLADVPWAADWHEVLATAPTLQPLGLLAERTVATLGLLAPVLLVYTITRPGLRRLPLAAGALALGLATMTLSTLLNFGPPHALTWLTPSALVALAAATLLAVALAAVPLRVMPGLALVALSAQVALVSQAPMDPYYAQNLQAWEQGRFIHFHGLAQWIGWTWPFLAMAGLLVRLGRRGD